MKLFSLKYRFILLAVMLTASTGVAQVRRMTLAECMAEAQAANPGIKAGRLAVERARNMQGTAFDPEATSVTLSQDATGGGSPENGVTVSQDFDFPTVYVARSKALKAETQLERLSLDAASAQLCRDVTSAYYAMLYARRVVEVNQQVDSIMSRFVQLATARYEAGETSRLEQMNAERAFNANKIKLDRARADYDAACVAMWQLIGGGEPVEPADESFGVIVHTLPTAEVDFYSTPAGLVASGRVALSECNLSVARQGYLPGITVGATVQALIKGFNPYDVERERFRKGDFMGFEVGLKLPLFFGATRARANSARRDVEMARELSLQARTETESRYSALLTAYASQRRALDYYENTGLAQADEMERLSQVSYELGDIGYIEYIQNLQAAADVRLEYAAAVNEFNLTIINLNYLQGKQ